MFKTGSYIALYVSNRVLHVLNRGLPGREAALEVPEPARTPL